MRTPEIQRKWHQLGDATNQPFHHAVTMKQLLVPFIALALCPPVHATAYNLNVKGWNQPDWWQCDDRTGLVRLPFLSPDYMYKSWCVVPSTFIKTSGGGRVRYQYRSMWRKDYHPKPRFAKFIKHPSIKGDKSGRVGWMEVNCQTMESRENQLFLVATTSPNMNPTIWRKISWQSDSSIATPGYGWTKMTPMTSIGPVEKWICERSK